jgi:hypothetical protein
MNMELITTTSTAIVQLKRVLLGRLDAPAAEKDTIIRKIRCEIDFVLQELQKLSSATSCAILSLK